MEYIYYILITLGVIAVSLFVLRLPGQSRLKGSSVELSRKAENRKLKQRNSHEMDEIDRKRAREILRRELSNVPTPWGWPGHDPATVYRRNGNLDAYEVNGVGESVHRWVDKLLREKQTVQDQEYRLKREANMRALLEDRYGNASKLAKIRYSKVKAPRLRDPREPHEQMDNFPSGQAGSIEARISRQPQLSDLRALQTEPPRKVALKAVKTPWGW